MVNDEELIGRILEWFKTGSSRPFWLELRPTNRCNLRCPSCVARGHPHGQAKGEELSEQDYMRIIDEAAGLGVRHVQISGGGEPFMRSNILLRMMRRIKHHGMEGWVITNGTLFTEEIIDNIVRMGWDTVFLSLDAPQPEVNDFLRGKQGSFDEIVSSIRLFNEVKKRYGSDAPHVHVGPVLSHYTCRQIGGMVRLCAGLGVDMVLFQPLRVPDTEAGRQFMLTKDDIDMLSAEIPLAQKLAGSLGVRTNLHELDRTMLEGSSRLPEVIQSYSSDFKEHPFLSIHCFSPWFYVGINAGGTVGPCSIDHPSTYKGDIRNTSLRECWQESHFQEFRECLKGGEIPEVCVNCCGTKVIDIRNLREHLQELISK